MDHTLFKSNIRKIAVILLKIIVLALIFGIGLILKIKGLTLQGFMVMGLALVLIPFFFLGKGIKERSKQDLTEDPSKTARTWIAILLIVLTVVLAVQPMELSPVWNGEQTGHRNQYELLADCILKGQLYFDYDVDPNLLAMENPYDPAMRTALGVQFHWDHAFYNGHYYMYFGVVPVFLVYLPYRVVTGQQLTGYKGTQIFAAFFILGMFMLISKLKKIFFKELPFLSQMIMSCSFSILSVWYISSIPGLYSTPIISGMCMEIWSLYFFFDAVYLEEKESRQIIKATFGSLFGALAFGCRPTIALLNIVVIPLLVVYLCKKKKITFRLILKLIAAAMPYVVIIGLIFLYNYVRFDSPFEFGQSYQLTVADQHLYGSIFANFNLENTVYNMTTSLFGFYQSGYSGIFMEFPVFFFIFLLAGKKARKFMKENRLTPVLVTMFVLVFVIVVAQIMATPYLLERYKSDVLWILCILTFFSISVIHCCCEGEYRDRLVSLSQILCALAIPTSIVFFLFPHDYSFTAYYSDLPISKFFGS